MKKWQDKTRGGYRYTLARDENGEVMQPDYSGWLSGQAVFCGDRFFMRWRAETGEAYNIDGELKPLYDLIPAEPVRHEVVQWADGNGDVWGKRHNAVPDPNGNIVKVTIHFEDDCIMGVMGEVVKAEGRE